LRPSLGSRRVTRPTRPSNFILATHPPAYTGNMISGSRPILLAALALAAAFVLARRSRRIPAPAVTWHPLPG
jgi:hypothetical protein